MALLGKISAVLTANTQDFSRQIGTARRELNQFAQQARGLQFNLDNRALNGTLTQLQRFQRTLREIQNLQRQGLGAGLPDPGRLRQQLRAFEDVGRPLTDVKNQVERLSNALQSQLTPELNRIQGGFQRLYREIGSGTTTISAAEQRIDSLRARIVALGRATAAVGDFGRLADALNANNTGGSFFQARARDSLQRSLDLRNRAQAVPAAFRSDVFADLAVQAEESAERVARAAARVARAQLDIANTERNGGAVTPSQLQRRGIAQQRLDRQVSQQEAVNSLFDREIRSAQIQQIVSPRATEQVDVLINRLGALSAEARQLGGTRFSGLINAASFLVEQFNRGATSAAAATRAVTQLDRALNSARQNGPLNILGEQTNSLLYSQSDMMRRRIQSDFDSLTANRAATDPVRIEAGYNRDIALGRLNLNETTIPRTQQLAQQARDSGDAGAIRGAERLLQLNRQINAEYLRAENLNFAGNYREAESALQRVIALLRQQEQIEEDIAGTVGSANAARRQTELFLQSSGGSAEQLSQGARDAASDLSVARQFRGQIASGSARITIQAEIDRITDSVRVLQREMANVAASDLGIEEKAAELDRLDNEIRQSTAGLAGLVAQESDGVFREGQIDAAMQRGRNTAGSVSVSGAASAQLAFQQGLFAVDDFLSSTGGLEYKLRAIGNNITQLGLLLGQSGLIEGLTATKGLFIALGATIGANLGVALLKFATDTERASDQVETLNKGLERQRSLSGSLSSSYKSLAKSIGEAGLSGSASRNLSRSETLDEIGRQRRDLMRERVSATDPDAISARLQAKDLESRLQQPRGFFESEQDFMNRRVGIQQQIESLRQRERSIADFGIRRPITAREAADVILGGGRTVSSRQLAATGLDSAASLDRDLRDAAAAALRDAPDGRRGQEQAVRRQIEVLQNLRFDLEQAAAAGGPQGAEARAAMGGVDAEIGRLTSILNRFSDVALQNFAAADKVARRLFLLGDELDRGRAVVDKVFGELASSSAIGAEIDRLADVAEQLDSMANDAVERGEDPSAFLADAEAARGMARGLTAAASALAVFSDRLAQAADSVSSDTAAMQQRADQARREDIAFSTPETAAARQQAEQDAEEARKRERRFQDDIATARERAEAQLLADGDRAAKRRAEIDRQLAVPAGEIAPDGTKGGTVGERERLREERRRLDEDIRQRAENSPDFQAARRQRDEVTAELERAQSVDRGRELARSPAERAGRELGRNLRDLQAAFDAGQIGNPQDLAADQQRLIGESFRSAAPAIFGLADQVQNAVLQGPSRAALQASDVTTAQGAAELNRLLRGDDSARNQDLVELQKQSSSLEELVRIARENGAPPGVLNL
jgi:hypothetical protein